MASCRLPQDSLSFIIRHILGIDEVRAEGSLTQTRKQNLDLLQQNIGDCFVGKLVQSFGHKHCVVPCGSSFEELSLPHINTNIWGKPTVSEGDKETFRSDVDYMCVFQQPLVAEGYNEKSENEPFPTDDESSAPESQGKYGALDKTEPPTRFILTRATHPGYYNLMTVKRDEIPPPWRHMLIEDNLDTFLSAHQFVSYFHNLGTTYNRENPSKYHDVNHAPDVHGPAMKIPVGRKGVDDQFHKLLSEDVVWSLECRKWPSEADPWLSRQRLSGWPTQKVINEICQVKCHLVPIPHKRSTGLIRDIEWRLSFSQAECILAKTLTWEQRKCYLILKGLHYTHFSQPNCLSAYHLKTALFWFLEDEPQSNFNNLTLSKSFLKLIDKILEFLRTRTWPHYFIPENNMVSHIKADDLCQIEDKVGYVRYNLLQCLEECENILVGKKSFENNFAPVLKALKPTRQAPFPLIQPYIDSILNIANFYQLAGNARLSVEYYEEALGYCQEGLQLDPQNFVDIYQELILLIKDQCIGLGLVDKAIEYSELILNHSKIEELEMDFFPDVEDGKSILLANLGCLYHIKFSNEKATGASRDSNTFYKKACACFEKSLSCKVISPLARLEFGNFLFNNEEYLKAIHNLLKSLEELSLDNTKKGVMDDKGDGYSDQKHVRQTADIQAKEIASDTDDSKLNEANVGKATRTDSSQRTNDKNEIHDLSKVVLAEKEYEVAKSDKRSYDQCAGEKVPTEVATFCPTAKPTDGNLQLSSEESDYNIDPETNDGDSALVESLDLSAADDNSSTVTLESGLVSQVINYGEFECCTVDSAVKRLIQSVGTFLVPAVVYSRYLLARCLVQLGKTEKAKAEIPRLSNIIELLIKHDPCFGSLSTNCSVEIYLAICEELGDVEASQRIRYLRDSVGDQGSPLKGNTEHHVVPITGFLPSCTEQSPGNIDISESHLKVKTCEQLAYGQPLL